MTANIAMGTHVSDTTAAMRPARSRPCRLCRPIAANPRLSRSSSKRENGAHRSDGRGSDRETDGSSGEAGGAGTDAR